MEVFEEFARDGCGAGWGFDVGWYVVVLLFFVVFGSHVAQALVAVHLDDVDGGFERVGETAGDFAYALATAGPAAVAGIAVSTTSSRSVGTG